MVNIVRHIPLLMFTLYLRIPDHVIFVRNNFIDFVKAMSSLDHVWVAKLRKKSLKAMAHIEHKINTEFWKKLLMRSYPLCLYVVITSTFPLKVIISNNYYDQKHVSNHIIMTITASGPQYGYYRRHGRPRQ